MTGDACMIGKTDVIDAWPASETDVIDAWPASETDVIDAWPASETDVIDAWPASETDVIDALRSVDDPEYPGVSVVDMGMIVAAEIIDGRATVELITTFSGCPAFDIISSEIARAVGALDGLTDVEVRRSAEAWDTSRLSEHARTVMARDFTVAVSAPGKPTECPRCGEAALVEQSPFGPARCRAVHRCGSCQEIVEVLRA